MATLQIAVATGTASTASADVAGLRVSDLRFAPDAALPEHEHERPCLAVLLGGAVAKTFVRRELEIATGAGVTMPAHARHGDRFGPAGARILVIEPDPAQRVLTEPYRRLLGDVRRLAAGGLSPVAWRLARELAEPDEVSPLALEAGALELLAGAARDAARPAAVHRRWLAAVEERLRAEPPARVSIAALAADAGVHPVHLARAFRSAHGVGPAAYVRRARLDWAAGQLARGDDPLACIAQAAGFADQAHFTRAFRTAMGVTPGRYRAQLRGERPGEPA